MTVTRLLAASTLVLALTAGCSDDDNGADLAVFCEGLAQFDGQRQFPSDDELDRIAASAPADIRSDVDAAATMLKQHGEDLIGDPTLAQHLDAIAEYRDANCQPS